MRGIRGMRGIPGMRGTWCLVRGTSVCYTWYVETYLSHLFDYTMISIVFDRWKKKGFTRIRNF
jgi:hypothetical protein